MIIGGIDASGNPNEGNYRYASIVLGEASKILSVVEKNNLWNIHMRHIQDRRRHKEILSKLKFDRKDMIAFCIKTERGSLISAIKSAMRADGQKTPHRKIFRVYNHQLRYNICPRLEDFLNLHRCKLADVAFQCDSDSWGFLKDNGLRHAPGREAHILSDIVAWANNRNREPWGTIKIDLAAVLKAACKRALL